MINRRGVVVTDAGSGFDLRPLEHQNIFFLKAPATPAGIAISRKFSVVKIFSIKPSISLIKVSSSTLAP